MTTLCDKCINSFYEETPTYNVDTDEQIGHIRTRKCKIGWHISSDLDSSRCPHLSLRVPRMFEKKKPRRFTVNARGYHHRSHLSLNEIREMIGVSPEPRCNRQPIPRIRPHQLELPARQVGRTARRDWQIRNHRFQQEQRIAMNQNVNELYTTRQRLRDEGYGPTDQYYMETMNRAHQRVQLNETIRENQAKRYRRALAETPYRMMGYTIDAGADPDMISAIVEARSLGLHE